MGRASRHLEGKAILYADRITRFHAAGDGRPTGGAGFSAPTTRSTASSRNRLSNKMDMGLAEIISRIRRGAEEETAVMPELATQAELDAYIGKLETEMREAARKFEFERAARLRDSIKKLREKEFLFG